MHFDASCAPSFNSFFYDIFYRAMYLAILNCDDPTYCQTLGAFKVFSCCHPPLHHFIQSVNLIIT